MTGVKGVISGNYYFSGGAVLIGGGGGGFNSQTDLHFTGTYRSDRELCDTINTIIPYNFSGYYYTAAAKPVFAWNTLTANTYINYNGAVLKNAGGDKLLIPSASYNNGYERYIATNEAMYNSRIQATETYRLEQDADSIRITYLSGPLVAATNTGALYSAATDTMFNNVANANLTADESYTTDWQDHSITFDFSGAPLDSMVYRFPSPDGKLQGLYVSDGEGNMSFIVNKIQSTDFDNMLDHNNAGIITLGNVNDSTIIHGDMIFIESPNMPQNDTLQNAYTKGAGNKVSLTKIPYSGITTATTDGSGDITVTLGITMPDNTYAVTATPQSSTFQVCNVVSKTATSFVLRFYTAVGVPITSTEVTANWIVRDN